MLELYFILYRIPKMMSQAARVRHRSALAWSLIGIGVWLVTQTIVAVGLAVGYSIVAFALDSDQDFSSGFRFLAYLVSLIAAIISVTLVRRRLLATPPANLYSSPPPPPTFS